MGKIKEFGSLRELVLVAIKLRPIFSCRIYIFFILWCNFPAVLARVAVVGNRSHGNKRERADDEPSKGLSLRQDNDKDELDCVHRIVEPVLNAVHDATVFLLYTFLKC